MPFLIECNNKGCAQLQSPYIDPETDIVYCSKCDQEIKNVSIFTKRQMKSLKQIKVKEKKSFSIKCPNCKTDDRPKLIEDNIVCSKCSKNIDNISPFFKNMLKTQLNSINKEEEKNK